MLDKRLGVLVETLRELDLASQNVLVDSHRVIVVEGVDTSVHLVDKNPESPPVDSLPVALVENNLWSNVLWGSADRECSSLVEDLGETEVSEFQVPVVSDQQVLRLQVPEDDVLAVQVLEAGSDCGRVELGLVTREGLH